MLNSNRAHEILFWAQNKLEDFYGAKTGLDVREFVRFVPNLENLGKLHIQQDIQSGDIDIALLLDRDMQSAWQSAYHLQKRSMGVLLEECSHFVYLGFNHLRKRNISQLEMELQSEVDRIVLAFHPEAPEGCSDYRESLLLELHEVPYCGGSQLQSNFEQDKPYETARRWASLLLKRMSPHNLSSWSLKEATLLREFFHRDLSEKIHLLRSLRGLRL